MTQRTLSPDREPLTAEARARIARETNWAAINRQRGELIKKNIAGTITKAEQIKLNALQAYADCYIDQVAPRPPVTLETLEARARRSGPETSHQAAASVNTTRSQRLVLDVFQTWADTPLTADQVEERLRGRVPPSRVRGALQELRDRNPPLVVLVGRRKNEQGHMAQTYRTTEDA